MKTCNSFSVKIFIAGDIDKAKEFIYNQFETEGNCVNVQPTEYIYTGGREEGMVIEFINYARFPSNLDALVDRAIKMAYDLIIHLDQRSASVVGERLSHYLQREDI